MAPQEAVVTATRPSGPTVDADPPIFLRLGICYGLYGPLYLLGAHLRLPWACGGDARRPIGLPVRCTGAYAPAGVALPLFPPLPSSPRPPPPSSTPHFAGGGPGGSACEVWGWATVSFLAGGLATSPRSSRPSKIAGGRPLHGRAGAIWGDMGCWGAGGAARARGARSLDTPGTLVADLSFPPIPAHPLSPTSRLALPALFYSYFLYILPLCYVVHPYMGRGALSRCWDGRAKAGVGTRPSALAVFLPNFWTLRTLSLVLSVPRTYGTPMVGTGGARGIAGVASWPPPPCRVPRPTILPRLSKIVSGQRGPGQDDQGLPGED